MDRWAWELVPGDLVSGAVICAVIIVSFLSLMSFADFLRVEWQNQRGLWGPAAGAADHQRRGGGLGARLAGRGQPGGGLFNAAALDGLGEYQDNVDDSIWEHVQQRIVAQQDIPGRPLNPRLGETPVWQREEEDEDAGSANPMEPNHYSDEDDDEDESWMDEEDDDDDNDSDDDIAIPRVARNDGGAQHPAGGNAARVGGAPFDMNAIPPDDGPDVDMNIALDELLGVRGPVGGVFRNLLWLLAFNTVYLGFFTFTPRVLGTAIISVCFNTTKTVDPASNETAVAEVASTASPASFYGILSAVEVESERQSTTFRLPDLATVTLGYFTCALVVLFMRLLWLFSQKIGAYRRGNPRTGEGRGNNHNPDHNDMRDALDEMHRLVHGLGQDMANIGDEPAGLAVGVAIGVALDAMVASVKVGVLLFMKMFMLPITLGICLDATLMPLLGLTLESRVVAAGQDLFSFTLLHWVAGITFMLLVTVSVLQLREVAHPDLLGQMIRPQEPQPDLLGNLMHEKVGTHARRMILSLIIYTALLTMHVYVPIIIIKASGLAHFFPFQLKFWYPVMAQLQIPFELLLFHLSMLALLEKYKNSIGGMQHHWLKFTTQHFGLADAMLPRKVSCFRLVGSRPIFDPVQQSVDEFWADLSKAKNAGEDLLGVQLALFDMESMFVEMIGETKPNGDRVLFFGSDFIRLPARLPGRALRTRSFLLPTKIGRYRLNARGHASKPVIQVWEEVFGDLIARPPEGWDDLGAGGADVQGRWAWGKEKKSAVEGNVARRKPFVGKNGVVNSTSVFLKLFMVFILSWAATTALLGFMLSAPLLTGRFVYFLLSVPDKWIHDPLAFVAGLCILSPPVRNVTRSLVSSELHPLRRLGQWLGRFHFPSFPKMLTLLATALLWFGLIPVLVGALYDVAFLKSTAWFAGQEQWVTAESALRHFGVGTLLLAAWARVCQAGILTRPFWEHFAAPDNRAREGAAAAGAGAADAPEDNTAVAQAADNPLPVSWQGPNGRIGQFWDVWKAVLLSWEWDKVDHVVLLYQCAIPVAFQVLMLATAVVASLTCVAFSDGDVFIDLNPVVLGRFSLTQAFTVRGGLLVILMLQLHFVWQKELGTWFQAVHRTARDERYLIGQVLKNYGEE